jgi:hypothetical protein
MRTSDQIEKVAAAIVNAQKEMGNAVKDSKNPFFKSTYADINAIREVILPVAAKYDLAILQLPATLEGKNYIETVILHSSGQFVAAMDEVVVAKQNDPQSKLAAQTYTRRGSMQASWNIGAEDDDGNTASGRAPEPNKDLIKPTQRASGFKAAPAADKPALEDKKEEKQEPKADDKPAEPAAPRRGSFGGR